MQDKDCCENCIYFLEGKTSVIHTGGPSREWCDWVEPSFWDKMRHFLFHTPIRRRQLRDFVVETRYDKTNSICRKGHQSVVKDESEWCGDYKAKD